MATKPARKGYERASVRESTPPRRADPKDIEPVYELALRPARGETPSDDGNAVPTPGERLGLHARLSRSSPDRGVEVRDRKDNHSGDGASGRARRRTAVGEITGCGYGRLGA